MPNDFVDKFNQGAQLVSQNWQQNGKESTEGPTPLMETDVAMVESRGKS
jgi:hypothetical protein